MADLPAGAHPCCAHCGRRLERLEASVAVVRLGSGDTPRNVQVCHPDDPALLDCYRLVTVYGELVGQRKEQQ